jgi:hypothetical protein
VQRSVNWELVTRPLATRMRVRFLAAIGAAACGNGQPSEVPVGLVAAPMTSASTGDAGADAGAVLGSVGAKTARPLPAEPKPPSGQSECERHTICRAEDDETPSWPLPAPFERCRLSLGKPAASFSAQETQTARAWDTKACCYLEFLHCSRTRSVTVPGRPLRDAHDASPIVAPARPRTDWSSGEVAQVGRRAEIVRRAEDRGDDPRAARWIDDACMEHASIASFARLTLQLLALGAPATLVEASLRAGLDEVRHARLSFGIASAYAGSDLGPDVLPRARASAAGVTFASLALETLRDGCVNETLAAAAARWRAEDESDPAAATALRAIADDEERHAELAWQTLAWAIERGGDSVRDAVAAARRRLLEDVPEDARSQRVLGEVIVPCVDALTRRR